MINKTKKAQEQKSKILVAMPKKAQEEMVGFALIMIIVSIILMVLLVISMNASKKEAVESYEVDSFIQSFLEYTTDCRDDLGYLSTRELIFQCSIEARCSDGRNPCSVLNSTLESIISESWEVSEETPIQGYELRIVSNEEDLLVLREGNSTRNLKGSSQDFVRRGDSIDIFFTAYY
jgi:maltodextrin utilization protein YvdJ